MAVMSGQKTSLLTATIIAIAGFAHAQVPPEIAKQLVAIGRGVCVEQTAKLYRPLHPNPPYKGVTILRDVSFGPDPKNVLDVFSPEKGGGSRTVLIYISGGAGNKQQGGPNGDVFYDNIMLWAVKNGMVGVNMQRRAAQGLDAGKDVGLVVQWVSQNISQHKGNPGRVFMWSQSAGNGPASTYVGHSELYGHKGVGIKGAIFMSSPGFNILPATPQPGQGGGSCNDPATGAPAAAAGRGAGGGGRGPGAPAPGAAPGANPGAGKGGGGNAKGGGGGGRGGGQDPAQSNLPGLIASKLPLFVSVAELDPPNVMAFNTAFKDALCMAGRCPTYAVFKDHSHISEVMSPDTADNSVTGPILKWMKSVK